MVDAIVERAIGVDKQIQLFKNFRSHSGILNVANFVVQTLMDNFRGSVDKCQPDQGLSNGPRPQMCRAWTTAEPMSVLHGLCRQNERRRVLVWDKNRAKYSTGPLSGFVFGIRESKGLEHSHVVILNFFSDLPKAHQQAWKWLATKSGSPPVLPVEMVLQLKMLYVGITRCCQDLVFVETHDSRAGNAWIRHLTASKNKLAVELKTFDFDTASGVTMGPDEWLVEGLTLLSTDDFDAGEPDVQRALSAEAVRLEQAAACFRKAANHENESRCVLQKNMIEHCLSAGATGAAPSVVGRFASSLVQCLREGLGRECSRVLRQHVKLLCRNEKNRLIAADRVSDSPHVTINKIADRIDGLWKEYVTASIGV